MIRVPRITWAACAASALCSCAAPPAAGPSPIVFRQHELERGWSGGTGAALPSDFGDPHAVLRACFAHLPPVAKVYPTEGYYYFRARLRDRAVSGNFRVLRDQAETALSFAYFDVAEPSNYRALLIPRDDDAFTVDCLAGERTAVGFDGVTKVFQRDDRFRAARGEIELDPHERLVSGVLDESGVWFSLVYNTRTRFFYYLRNPSDPSDEAWIQAAEWDGGRLLIGRDSGFALLAHHASGRELLAGVRRADVLMNTYFDGPFDQVPPDLDLAPLLIDAYPYVARGGGIDRHGGFVDQPGVRVAISPYQVYDTRRELVTTIDRAMTGPDDFDRIHQTLCHEPKRDAHRTPSRPRRNWPANHFSTVSHTEDGLTADCSSRPDPP